MKNVVYFITPSKVDGQEDSQTIIEFEKADEIIGQLFVKKLIDGDAKVNQANGLIMLVSLDITKEAKDVIDRLDGYGFAIKGHESIPWNKQGKGDLDSNDKMAFLGISEESKDEYLGYIELANQFVAGINKLVKEKRMIPVKYGRHIGNIVTGSEKLTKDEQAEKALEARSELVG